MADSRNTGGARALLFERLVDTEPDQKESPPFRVLSRQELRKSVSRELGQLLNSRCPTPLQLIGEEERTVINYGLPDFTSLSPQSADDRRLIASIIAQTITAFETRLRNVRVTAEYFEDDERKLYISVEADLVTDAVIEIRSYPEFSSRVEPVSFPIVLNNRTGIMEMYENE
ncbi:MAG TPA: type VI secretion system baseplate subunit TssE [Pyrinomonadaceae bacterium]|nr:type VI secretion system baseplate subunit TssE [Pyrinomonadaceae bacterium]